MTACCWCVHRNVLLRSSLSDFKTEMFLIANGCNQLQIITIIRWGWMGCFLLQCGSIRQLNGLEWAMSFDRGSLKRELFKTGCLSFAFRETEWASRTNSYSSWDGNYSFLVWFAKDGEPVTHNSILSGHDNCNKWKRWRIPIIPSHHLILIFATFSSSKTTTHTHSQRVLQNWNGKKNLNNRKKNTPARPDQ